MFPKPLASLLIPVPLPTRLFVITYFHSRSVRHNGSSRVAPGNTRNRRILSASPATAGGNTVDSIQPSSGSEFPSTVLSTPKTLGTNVVCFADSSAQWTSVPCTSTMIVNPSMTSPTNALPSSIPEGYILGYVPNAINVITTGITSPGGPERQAYAFITQPPLTGSNLLLMHSEQTELEPHPAVAVVCDPVTNISPNPSMGSRKPHQSNAFVYAISPSINPNPHTQKAVPQITESPSLSQPKAAAQMFVVSPINTPSPAFTGPPSSGADVIDTSIMTASASSVTPISHLGTAVGIQSSRSSLGAGEIHRNSESLEAIRPADAPSGQPLISSSDSLDNIFDSESKPEESLLPDEIINAVFGCEFSSL